MIPPGFPGLSIFILLIVGGIHSVRSTLQGTSSGLADLMPVRWFEYLESMYDNAGASAPQHRQMRLGLSHPDLVRYLCTCRCPVRCLVRLLEDDCVCCRRLLPLRTGHSLAQPLGR